jgi:hypothetical protein
MLYASIRFRQLPTHYFPVSPFLFFLFLLARQRSINKLEGTIGRYHVCENPGCLPAKERTSMNGARITIDPAFQRTRENNVEFGRAGKAGNILRNALRGQLQKASDSE